VRPKDLQKNHRKCDWRLPSLNAVWQKEREVGGGRKTVLEQNAGGGRKELSYESSSKNKKRSMEREIRIRRLTKKEGGTIGALVSKHGASVPTEKNKSRKKVKRVVSDGKGGTDIHIPEMRRDKGMSNPTASNFCGVASQQRTTQ